MFGCCATGDVGWLIECRDKDPRVFENLLCAKRIESYRNIGPGPHAMQPALISPAGQALGSLNAIDIENTCHSVDGDDVASRLQDLGQSGPALREELVLRLHVHMQDFSKSANYCSYDILLGRILQDAIFPEKCELLQI